MVKPTALKAVRLQALIPSYRDTKDKGDTLDKLDVRSPPWILKYMGHEPHLLLVMAYAQMPLISAHSNVRCLNFGLSLHLHTYFVNVSSKGSGKSVHMHRVA